MPKSKSHLKPHRTTIGLSQADFAFLTPRAKELGYIQDAILECVHDQATLYDLPQPLRDVVEREDWAQGKTNREKIRSILAMYAIGRLNGVPLATEDGEARGKEQDRALARRAHAG